MSCIRSMHDRGSCLGSREILEARDGASAPAWRGERGDR